MQVIVGAALSSAESSRPFDYGTVAARYAASRAQARAQVAAAVTAGHRDTSGAPFGGFAVMTTERCWM
jgi:hypothetical protein